jgi:NADH-quinone oxidoreductase subunit C
MTVFAVQPEALKDTLVQILGDQVSRISVSLGEVSVVVNAANYLAVTTLLRDAPGCKFEQLIDLCGMDYSSYQDGVALTVGKLEPSCSYQGALPRR